jgi:hypothetical protein
VVSVDLFDASAGTPTLGQLEQYQEVVAFSNNAWSDATAMGNVLADYQDAGGVVVVTTFAFDNRGGWLLGGRWVTGGYTPFNSTNVVDFTDASLGQYIVGHPLMQGVSTLSAHFRNGVTLTAGASQVATYTDSIPMVAVKTTGGHTGVAINAYLGFVNTLPIGDWGKLIVNAVRWLGGGSGCGTPTHTATPGAATATPTHTSTPGAPTATATCSPSAAGWSSIASIIASPGLTRAGGTYFPANGKIYVIGGRTTDSPDQGSQTIYSYNPASDTWATAATALTDTKVSNLVVALLTGPSGPRIYAVGGSYPSGSMDLLPTNIVRVYDPVGGSLVQADNWPQTSPLVIPGGWAVFNNKLYIFGGYDPVAVAMIPDIWQFDPMAAPGSQWTHKSAMLDLARAYIATQTIGSHIYLAGGFDATLTDQVTTERYDPATDTICDACMADLPAATSNAKGYTDGTLFFVPGGTFPTPENTTRIYNPATDTWTVGSPMVGAARNYANATIGTTFYAIGGYDGGGAITAVSQKYSQGTACGTATATPTSPAATSTMPPATPTSPAATATRTTAPATATAPPAATATRTTAPATATHTPAATPTSCTLQFSDVPVGSTFYPYIHCLACLGIVNGYPDGTFRPNANVTRGQLSKIVANSAGFNDTPSGQQFQDVPVGSTFYVYIYRLVHRGYISGYACGGPGEPCVPPDNMPYFRPNAYATRGQISKIVSNAAGFSDTPSGQQFQDVPVGSTFYDYIYRLSHRGIISGYACGGPGEPCVPPANLPYFRPNNNATRGQMSKIDGLAFFPNCNILARPKAASQ